jgi:hypothetical protein
MARVVTVLRLALQVFISTILSVSLGLAVALLSFGPSRPFPFSQCMEYSLNSPPSSCSPLAPILLLLAGCLLFLAAFSLSRNRLKRKAEKTGSV